MAKAKKRTARKSAPQVDSKAKSKEEIQKVRNKVTNVIVDSAAEMAERVVQSVTESGQVTALKYLWEVAGLFPADGEAENGEPDSLAKILLERMGFKGELPSNGPAEDGDVESESASSE
jgi:hypothetical protein